MYVLKYIMTIVLIDLLIVLIWSLLEMGIYLSSPKTDKVSEDGENGKLRYGLSSMQGWRATMEDAVSSFPYYSWFTYR